MIRKSCVAAAAAILLTTACSRHPQTVQAASDYADARTDAAAPSAAPAAATAPTIPAGTRFRVRLSQALDTKYCRAGQAFTAVLDEPIVLGDRVIVRRGAWVRGHITESKPSGRLKGRAVLAITLDSVRVDGTAYAIATNPDARVSRSHKRRNLAIIGGGAGTGAAIGAATGGGVGAAIGAGVGAGAGTVGAVFTGRKQVVLPAETELMFSLRRPFTVGS